MRELTEQEKQELQEHYKWLTNDGGKRLDWSCKDLSDVNLSRAILTDTNLTRADLTGADLTRANLTHTKGLTKVIGGE